MTETSKSLAEVLAGARERAGLSCNKQLVNGQVERMLELAQLFDSGELPISAIRREFQELLDDAKEQMASIRRELDLLNRNVNRASADVKALAERYDGLGDAQGRVHDQRAQDVVALQAILMDEYKRGGVTPDVAARCASYTLWAYLGAESDMPHDEGLV